MTISSLLPTFYGVTKKVPEYKNFLIGTDILTVAPKDGARTCEEIAAARAKSGQVSKKNEPNKKRPQHCLVQGAYAAAASF